MTFDPNDYQEPTLVDLTHVFAAQGVMVVAVTVPEEAPEPFKGRRGLMFQFGVLGVPGGHLQVFVPADAVDDSLGLLIHSVVTDLFDEDRMRVAADRALDANLRAGFIKGGAPIYCPGCNARLFGEVANRGGCLSCYPDLPSVSP